MNFAALIAGAEATAEGLALEVPESWHQGRTAYGGFSAALALVAARRAGGEGLAPLRSAQVSMVAPVSGLVEARAMVVRQGRNATWISAEIRSGGALAFLAMFVFMGPVESGVHLNDRTAPANVVPLTEGREIRFNDHSPMFLRNHFESRHAMPPSEGAVPELCRWVRLSDGGPDDVMVELLLVADALPPGVMPLLSARVPVSTMQWQVNLLTPDPVTQDGWWLLRSSGDYAEKGCSSQRMGLWNAAGEPVMAGMQSVALFG